MDFTLKIVTKLPLESLWNEKEFVDARKQGTVTAADIKKLLPAAQFVVADIGHALRWIDVKETFEFWKTEVREHLLEPHTKVLLEDLPDTYGYRATVWITGLSERKIILLEMIH